jgi:hypothetical protein
VTAGIEHHASDHHVLAQPPPDVGEVEQDADKQARHVRDTGYVDDGRVDGEQYLRRPGRELARELLERRREVGRLGIQNWEPDRRPDSGRERR